MRYGTALQVSTTEYGNFYLEVVNLCHNTQCTRMKKANGEIHTTCVFSTIVFFMCSVPVDRAAAASGFMLRPRTGLVALPLRAPPDTCAKTPCTPAAAE